MNRPTNRTIFEGEIADYHMDNGILISLSKSPKRTIENISSNIELVKSITGNKKVPLIIYLCKSPVPDKETQQFSARMLPEIYRAIAMVSKPGLSAFIIKLLFKLKKPPIPIKNFTDDALAKDWLKKYL